MTADVKIKNINNRTHCFFNWRLSLKLTKNRQKAVQKHWHLLHWIHRN